MDDRDHDRKRSRSQYDDENNNRKIKKMEGNVHENENDEKERAIAIPNPDIAAAATIEIQNFLCKNPILSSFTPEQQKQLFNNVLNSKTSLQPAESREKTLWDFIPLNILRKLENHQKEAIKFLIQRVIGNVEKFDESGNGAILAHNMGLGKTLTIIVFLYAVLSFFQNKNNVPCVLLVVPKNVFEQWKSEIKAWINKNKEVSGKIKILEAVPKKNKIMSNYEKIGKWHKNKNERQILLLTYEQLKKHLDEKKSAEYLFLPDIVIFDEAHRLKNDETKIYETAAQIQTNRRIFITGTPHQNNLMEFYTLVNLIDPRPLNTKESFLLHFVKPIEEGQCKDANPAEVRRMRIRCYALYEMLVDIIHRKSCKTLKELLVIQNNDGSVKNIEKFEMTIKVRPSNIQNKLLNKYLARTDSITELRDTKKAFFTDVSAMGRLLAHPTLLHRFAEESKKTHEKRLQEQIKRFPQKPYVTLFTKEWMEEYSELKEEDEFECNLSYKMVILMDIIKQCEVKGDKLLIFTQYCHILDFIEELLQKNEKNWFESHKAKAMEDGQNWGWKRDIDYYRIDGQVSAEDRHENQEEFNKDDNKQCRLMLISTKAGALGTNLIGANRVILFDGCFNPTLDTQSLYRTYRLKQTKDVFVYRLVTHGTMNDAIYKNAIMKESTSHRVLDNETIYNLFTKNDLNIYVNEYVTEDVEPIVNHGFSDAIIDTILEKNPKMIVSVESHDSFFDPCENDELTDDELLCERLSFVRRYRKNEKE